MSVITPNMSLIESTIGVDSGLVWEQNINASLDVLDGHNHSPGSGVPITPDGINVNADFSFNSNNAVDLKSIRFTPQSSLIAGSSPNLGCLYESGVDLYFNDGSGNQIRLTNAGSIAGATGSISGLVAPASASYVSLSQTFIFQSGVSIPANIDVGAIILRDVSLNSKGITLSPPAALAADYNITYPAATPQKNSVQNVASTGGSVWESSYDAIVGSSAQITAGSATHSTLSSAISAVSANGQILVLQGAWTENITLSKTLTIVGSGYNSVITGDMSFVGVNYSKVIQLRFTGNVSLDSSSNGNTMVDSYIGATSTATDSGAGNYIEVISG